MTGTDLLAAAVANNVHWCGLATAGGGTVDRTAGVWTADGPPPPLFPDAVTLAPGASARRAAALLAGRRVCSVKDSFADVDLAPHGFTELFRARWLALEPATAPPCRGWWRVETPAAFEAWCVAAGLPAPLPAALLGERSVRVLATGADGPGGPITAGLIVADAAGVAGVSNVFGPDVWPDVATVVAQQVPGRPVVGYEHGADLDDALAAGFVALGPLRVWMRG